MSWLETLRTGCNGIRSHRLRSGLTVLGILIGIAAVILTVGLGEGAQAQVSSEITSLGTNLLTISPGSTTSAVGIRGGFGSASTLTTANAAALASSVVAPDIKAVAPTTQATETLIDGSTNWSTTVVGTTPSWLTVRGRTVAQGRFLDNQDVQDHEAVVVLGSTTASELFSREDPVGQTVDVSGVPMTVVGVLTSVGSSSSSSTTTDQDDQALVPITTAAQRIFGGTSRNSVSSIIVQARSSNDLTAAYQEADHELLAAHDITDGFGCRLHHHLGAVGSLDGHIGRPDIDDPARGYCGHLSPRRRHRCHEHHVGLGHRTGARDRVAQGSRSNASTHSAPISGGGIRARARWRSARRRARNHRSGDLARGGRRPHHHQRVGRRGGARWSPWRSGSSSVSTPPVAPPTWPPSTR